MPLPTATRPLCQETDTFVGRDEALAELQEAAATGAVAYVHGPEGIGKSALLRMHAQHCAAQGMTVVWADLAARAHNGEGLEAALAAELALHLPPPTLAASDPWECLREAAARTPLLVCVDDYGMLDPAWQQALRERIRQHHGGALGFALAGRPAPARLWAHDARWRLALRDIPLRGLDREEADTLLERLGLRLAPHLRDELFACSAGTPGLLALAAHALRDHYGSAATGQAAFPSLERDGFAAFCIEQMLHPGSRRWRWRAGVGEAESYDTLLAAAAVLPAPLREFLPVVALADTGERHHALMRDSPLWQRTDEGRGGPLLEPGVRQRVATVLDRRRPWAARYWRRQALEHLLALAQGRSSATAGLWRMAAPVVAAYGRDLKLAPGAQREGARGATRGPTPRVPPLPTLGTQGAAADTPADLVFGLGPSGRGVVARRQGVTGPRCPGCLGVPGEAAVAKILGSAAVRACALALGAGDSDGWQMCTVGLRAEPRGTSDAADASLPCSLLGRSADGFSAVRHFAWVAEAGDDLPRRLGFTARVGPRGSEGARVYLLDPHRLDAVAWLQRAVRPTPFPEGLCDAEARVRAAKEALDALHDSVALARTTAAAFAAHAFNLHSAMGLRVWLTDMVTLADERVGVLSGRDILQRYYIERKGPHAAVAATLAVSTATYYRSLRQALVRFATVLFG